MSDAEVVTMTRQPTADHGRYDVVVVGGATAGSMINADLVTGDTDHAVQARHAPFSAASAARTSTRVPGDRRHGIPIGTTSDN